MNDIVKKVYTDGKKSLEFLLRERAYVDVKKYLEEENINIDEISDEDLEKLVVSKALDMENKIKGFGYGGAFMLVLSSVLGV